MGVIKFLYSVFSLLLALYLFNNPSQYVPELVWKGIWLFSAIIDGHRIYDYIKEHYGKLIR